MHVNIYYIDRDTEVQYSVTDPSECPDYADKSAAEEAFKNKDNITMGKIFAEYVGSDSNKEETEEMENQ